MKKGICMRLKCVECGIWHDIPDDKMDDFNIFWKGDNTAVNMRPNLLCPACTKKWANGPKSLMPVHGGKRAKNGTHGRKMAGNGKSTTRAF
jgi:hypothetical protein